ncbi:MAG: prolyl oligopeptidase family serine peptidase [Planctomycetaceae bacterium]|nr:prolyl oligopeptidase family serine peptidase [Planctomycetaceae bacterium]
MCPTIAKYWPKSRIRLCATAGATWIAANVAALIGIDFYESQRLAEEFGVGVSVIRQYKSRSVELPKNDRVLPVTLAYRFRRPPPMWTRRHGVPLLVYLHGSGERGSDNVQQLRSAPSVLCESSLANAFPCAVLAPQCPEGFHWSSTIDSEIDMLDAVLQMIDDVLTDFSRIDSQRIYLAGFSMGGYGAWALATRAPDRFAAVVPIAGGGDPAFAKRLVNVPLWAVHGADDEVVSVTQSQAMISAIHEAGGDPCFTELPEVGHQTWPVVFRDSSEILIWMFRQRLDGTARQE